MFRITQPSTSSQMGRAAEFLVCFDLLRRGLDAYAVPHSSSNYDVVLEFPHRLVRLQVKSTFKMEDRRGGVRVDGSYRQLQRFRFVRNSTTNYENIDGYAFVVLNESLIRYYLPKDVVWGAGGSKLFNRDAFRGDTGSFERFIRGLDIGSIG